MTEALKGTMTTADAASLFDVTVGTIREWIKKGDLVAELGENNRFYITRQSVAELAREKYGDE